MQDTRLGHYRIAGEIGTGGMGTVYRAHDEQLDRDVALKVLRADVLSDETARARLMREARAAAGVNHPNICTVFEVGEANGQAYIAMELVEGQCLSDLLQKHALPVGEVLRYGIQIADALAHAHARHIVHRDLKCGNVVVTPECRVKVLDFGLAKRLPGEDVTDETTQSQPSLTTPGTVRGTLAYMAPEQLRGERADARSDIWALGVMIFEMATGKRPFQGRTAFEVSSAILNLAPAELVRSAPPELRAVIERCLAKEPGLRYQHAEEVRAAFEVIQAGASVPRTAVVQRQGRLPRTALMLTGIILLAVLVGAGIQLLRARFRQNPQGIQSLAVLPLENLSGDPAQDYLASGIHEALITDLAKLSGFKRVIARTSVKRFANTTMTPQQIAQDLGVDVLMTGTVLRSGNHVQITAHLINALGNQIWSERYDREFSDILSLQNEIISVVVQEIKLQVTPQEDARLKAPRAVNAEAYEAYLQGVFYRQKQTREDLDIAERYFNFALQKDPNYALAYAGLGAVWLARGDAGWMVPGEAFPKGTAMLNKAVSLDDDSAEVHVWLANNKNAIEWDWPGAEKEFKRALELNPNLAEACFFYADMLIVTKRFDEWKEMIKRSRELDPLNDFQETYYGWHMNYLHRYDEAIPIFRKMLSTAPNKASSYLGLWGAYYKKGLYDESLSAAREYFITINNKDFADALGTGHGEGYYRAAMKRAGQLMAEESRQRHVPAIRIARMFTYAGDHDSAIQWLEKAYQARESPLIRLAVFWDWDDLRPDPRFQELLRRMNLPLSPAA